MRFLRKLRLRFGWLLRRSKGETDLSDERQDYIERQTGAPPGLWALASAGQERGLRDVGGIEQVKEECRDARGTLWIENTLQDGCYAWRTLCRDRGFTAAAICTLALGIGANTAIFDVIKGTTPCPFSAVEYHAFDGTLWQGQIQNTVSPPCSSDFAWPGHSACLP
jgi:putative ABC transport system permease protein